MGTPDGMGWIALFCLAAGPAVLLAYLAGCAVKSFREGDKKTALYDTIAFSVVFLLIAAAVLISFFT